MSLISDALKKAQRQRDEGTDQPAPAATDAAGTPAPRVARREKPTGFRSQMLLVIGGGAAVVVVGLVAGGLWLWQSSRKTETPAPKTEVAAAHPAPAVVPTATAPANPPPAVETKPAPAPVQVTEAPKPAPVAPVVTAGTPQFTLPLTPAPTSVTTPAATPAVATPTVAVAPKSNERPKPPAHMVTIIENLRVAGIRAAGEDSKVLMNDRVYRLNDIVDHELGLKLTGVTPKSLTFEDDHGATYTRNF
jgi:hypothetical protein